MTLRPGDDFDRDILDIIPERFDADYDSRQARAGSRLRTMITVVLAVFAIGGIVAAGLRFMGNKPAATGGAGIPVIKADDRPIKLRPDDRGGMEVPNQDKLVYDKMDGEADHKAEQLLAAPEQPMAPPKSASPIADSGNPGAAPVPNQAASAPANPPPAAAGQDTYAPPAGSSYRPVGERAQPQPQPQPQVAQALPPAQSQPPTRLEPSRPTAPAHTRESRDTRAAAQAPAPEIRHAPAVHKVEPAHSGGRYLVQLGAVRSAEAADKEWARISHAHADLLGGLKSDIIRVDLGAKGTFWRIRAGMLSDEAAHQLCRELAKHKQGCIVARK